MAVYTVYPSHDGQIRSVSSNYSYARAGTGGGLTYSSTGTTIGIGQYLNVYDYTIFQNYQTYNIGALGLGSVAATGAYLNLTLSSNYTTVDSTTYARVSTYSDTAFSTSDWVAGADSSSAALLASFNTVNLPYANDDFTFSSDSYLNTYITAQIAGKVKVRYAESRFETGNQPTQSNDEDYYIKSTESTGTTYDPFLYFETIPASAKTGSITANAYIKTPISSSLTANGQIIKNGFYANAVIKANGVTRSIRANAYIGKTTTKTVVGDSATGTAVASVFRSTPDSIRAIKIYRSKPIR